MGDMGRHKKKLVQFVLSLPRDLPAEEVVARAKARGMKLKKKAVARVRGAAPPVARPAAAVRSRAAQGTPGAAEPSDAVVGKALLAIASQVGLEEAIVVLKRERARVRELVGL
jgi:hypothetical protein